MIHRRPLCQTAVFRAAARTTTTTTTVGGGSPPPPASPTGKKGKQQPSAAQGISTSGKKENQQQQQVGLVHQQVPDSSSPTFVWKPELGPIGEILRNDRDLQQLFTWPKQEAPDPEKEALKKFAMTPYTLYIAKYFRPDPTRWQVSRAQQQRESYRALSLEMKNRLRRETGRPPLPPPGYRYAQSIDYFRIKVWKYDPKSPIKHRILQSIAAYSQLPEEKKFALLQLSRRFPLLIPIVGNTRPFKKPAIPAVGRKAVWNSFIKKHHRYVTELPLEERLKTLWTTFRAFEAKKMTATKKKKEKNSRSR